MAPVRLRHPKGVTTIQVDFDGFTVLDLMQEICAVTEIPPSLQDLKTGYPPHSLALIPELHIESLGLSTGEQLIVSQKQPGNGPNSPARPMSYPMPSPGRSDSQGSGGFGQPSSMATPLAPTPTLSTNIDPGKPDLVEAAGGFLVHRIVPDDNSCLFSSIALVFEQDLGKAQQMRRIVADEILKDMITWTEAILGRPRDDYIATILKPTSWGGAIELTILAKYYGTEICSVDVETGRFDHFSPLDAARISGNRCILIYSGIHYDAASLAPIKDAPADFHQTIMSIISSDPETDPILGAAGKLARKLRQKRAYTNTSTFTLKCEDCGQGLTGEQEARVHASQTGHVRFGEY